MLGMSLAGVLLTYLPWRTCFVVLGAPGLLAALAVRLVLRDPPSPPRASGKAPFALAVTALLKRQSYLWLLAGITLSFVGYYGTIQWLPSFFARTHRMVPAGIGVSIGVAAGLGSILGALAGAFISPRLIARDSRWHMWLPALSYLLCTPLLLAVLNLESVPAAEGAFFLAALLIGVAAVPALAAIQALARPGVRATAVAFAMLCSALGGQGGGPLLAGALSDLWSPRFGADGLRYALCVVSLAFLAAAVCSWLGATRFRQDEADGLVGGAPHLV